MSENRKIVTVLGATGTQGSSVIRRLLETSQYDIAVRAVVEPFKTSGPSMRVLGEMGVECIVVDLLNLESVQNAVQGSYGVFGMLDWWSYPDHEVQVRMGRNICDACLTTNVQHLIWSSAPSPARLSGDTKKIIGSFDSKAEVAEYIQERSGITGMMATYFQGGFFMSHISHFLRPDERGEPIYLSTWNADKVLVPLFDAAADTGKYVEGILRAGQFANGVIVQGVSEWISPRAIAEQMTLQDTRTGEDLKVRHVQTLPTVFRDFVPKPVRENVLGILTTLAGNNLDGWSNPAQQYLSDAYLGGGATKSSWREFIKNNGPWVWPIPSEDARVPGPGPVIHPGQEHHT